MDLFLIKQYKLMLIFKTNIHYIYLFLYTTKIRKAVINLDSIHCPVVDYGSHS